MQLKRLIFLVALATGAGVSVCGASDLGGLSSSFSQGQQIVHNFHPTQQAPPPRPTPAPQTAPPPRTSPGASAHVTAAPTLLPAAHPASSPPPIPSVVDSSHPSPDPQKVDPFDPFGLDSRYSHLGVKPRIDPGLAPADAFNPFNERGLPSPGPSQPQPAATNISPDPWAGTLPPAATDRPTKIRVLDPTSTIAGNDLTVTSVAVSGSAEAPLVNSANMQAGAIPSAGEMDRCNSEIATLENRKDRLEAELKKLEKEGEKVSGKYLREMLEMRRELIVDGVNDVLSLADGSFDQLAEKSLKSGAISHEMMEQLQLDLKTVKFATSTATAIHAATDRESEKKRSQQYEKSIEAANDYASLLLQAAKESNPALKALSKEEFDNLGKMGDLLAATSKALVYASDSAERAKPWDEKLQKVAEHASEIAIPALEKYYPAAKIGNAAIHTIGDATAFYYNSKAIESLSGANVDINRAKSSLRQRVAEYDTRENFYKTQLARYKSAYNAEASSVDSTSSGTVVRLLR